MSLFVNQNSTFDVSFACGLSKDGTALYCAEDEKTLKEVNADDLLADTVVTHTCTFRRPNYGDSAAILKGSLDFTDGKVEMNPAQANINRVARLLKAWTLKDEKGKPVPANEEAVFQLDPTVGTVIAYILDQKLAK